MQELQLPQDQSELISWLSLQQWPFHVNTNPSPDLVSDWIAEGMFSSPDTQSFWIMTSSQEKAGLLRIFDLEDIEDGNPMFDLRLRQEFRNQGIGRIAVKWMTDYLFNHYPELNRIEGNTRIDNQAMKHVMLACNFVKEGHFREGWRTLGGKRYDSAHYGILRRDWQSGSTTPIPSLES